MAVTKIWAIKATLERPIEYIQNPEKTTNSEFGKNQDESLDDDMQNYIHFISYFHFP